MKKIITIIIVLSIGFIFASISFADTEWEYYSGTEHWYKRVDSTMLWQDAQNYAESLGGYLATITSGEENNFVYSNLSAGAPHGLIWLGGFQPEGSAEPNGEWQWVTGETWDYTNWNGAQPDNNLGVSEQDYLSFYYGPTWDDGYNDQPLQSFIVESNTIVPEPISSTLFIIGGATLGFRRFRTEIK